MTTGNAYTSGEIKELIDLTLRHLVAEGLDDIFKPPLLNAPIEQKYLDDPIFQRSIRKYLATFLRNPKLHEFSVPLRLNVPKTRYTYRQASLLDIADLARYTALVFSIGEQIEEHRILKQHNVVFSSRFVKETPCFDKHYGHSEFRKQSDTLTRSGLYSVKVHSDIATFFDRLNIHRLESLLIDIGCEASIVRAINGILHHWAGRNSYGIPVGCDASRLLAEAMLINVDKCLRDHEIVYVRYVDDFRIFAKSYPEAHAALELLINALESEGLFINASKTRITDVASYIDDQDTDPNKGSVAGKFESIDVNAREEARRIVGTGYNARIAKYYKKPGEDAVKKLQEINLYEYFEAINTDNPSEDDLKEFVKAYIYGKRDGIALIFSLIDRHLHILAYVADALVKESGQFTQNERVLIGDQLLKLYEKLQFSDYYRICIARVMSTEPYFVKGVFENWLSALKFSANPAFIKELIAFFGPTLSRETIRALVRGSNNYHPSILRIIVSIALSSKCLHAERKAWAKIWMQSSDLLVRALCTPFVNSGEENNIPANDEESAADSSNIE